ncbi:MAG: DUF1571 domain-containing protein [Desulfobacterales bacterium]|nr:DUF1571 domain-containing protein [Desulfobacterales bacterium]
MKSLSKVKIIFYSFLALIIFFNNVIADTSAQQPDPIALSLEAPKIYETIQDYTAIFYKQERIGKKLMPLEKIQLKFRKPFDLYMKWIDNPYKGQEMLYKEGQNNGKILAHKGGFLGLVSVSVDPIGNLAMDNQHHAVFDAGLGSTINLIAKGLKKGIDRKEIKVNFLGEEKLEGRPVYVFEGVFPEKLEGETYTVQKGESLWDIAKKFDQDMYAILSNNKGIDDAYDVKEGKQILIPNHYCHKITVYIDKELRVPTKIINYDWKGNVYEMYQFNQLKINVGLTDKDFDPKNSDYKF